MTGFGKAQCEAKGKSITIELRTLNSKYLDINPRLPVPYREKEPEIRDLIKQRLQRGKIDLTITLEYSGSQMPQQINRELFTAYYQELKSLRDELQAPEADLMGLVLRMPNVITTAEEPLSESEWKAVKNSLETALQQVIDFRAKEGAKMAVDLKDNIRSILEKLEKIKELDPQRLVRIKARLQEQLNHWLGADKVDQNRLEQEILYYVEKLDINEEKVRLQTHCQHFLEALQAPQESKGKKLAFISQEIGREINTLGSKANDAEIQQLVVGMKDHLEQVKEQILNIL